MTTQTTGKPTLVESGRMTGLYDFDYTDAVVDDPKHGRVYISMDYGGESQLRGGCYRWDHGFAIRVGPATTLDEARQIHPRSDAAVILTDFPPLDKYADRLGL